MKLTASLLKISLLLSLLPTSVSALTIIISAPNDAATTLDVTIDNGDYSTHTVSELTDEISWGYYQGMGVFTETGYSNGIYNLNNINGIQADSQVGYYSKVGIDYIILRDTGAIDEFGFRRPMSHSWDGFYPATWIFSGSASFTLNSGETFGDFNIGTYYGSASSYVDDLTLKIQYDGSDPNAGSTSVPDTGSTAALLGLGVMALAFARRRLG